MPGNIAVDNPIDFILFDGDDSGDDSPLKIELSVERSIVFGLTFGDIAGSRDCNFA